MDGNGQRACEHLTDAVQRRIVNRFSEDAQLTKTDNAGWLISGF